MVEIALISIYLQIGWGFSAGRSHTSQASIVDIVAWLLFWPLFMGYHWGRNWMLGP